MDNGFLKFLERIITACISTGLEKVTFCEKSLKSHFLEANTGKVLFVEMKTFLAISNKSV